MKLAQVIARGVCLVLVAVPASAQTGSITGTISDAVTAAFVGGDGYSVTAYNAAGQPVRGATPDAAGLYQLQPLDPGTYFVKVTSTSSPHISQLHSNIPCVAVDCLVTSGTPVVVGPAATVTVDIALARAGVITGTVRRASDSTPVTSISVIVYNASTSLVSSTEASSTGTYTIGGLAAGTYFVRTGPVPGFGLNVVPELYPGIPCPGSFPAPDCRIASGTPVVVTAGATTAGIDFSLDPAGTISGTVVADGTATPIPNVPVVAYAGDVGVSGGFTNAGGQYIIPGLPPGSYRVRTNLSQGSFINEWHNDVCFGCSGTPASVAVGAGATVTVNLSLAVGGSISGTITCQKLIPSDWTRLPVIYVYSASGTLVRSVGISSFASCTPLTPSGTYTVEGLAAGQYYLLARDQLGIPFGTRPSAGILVDKLYGDIVCIAADCDVRRAVPVTVVPPSATTGIDFVVERGAGSGFVDATLPLTIYDERGVELVDVVRMNMIPLSGQHVVGIPDGTYFAKLGNQLHGGISCADCPPTSGAPIVVRNSQGLVLNFAAVSGRRVSGTVRDQAGSAPLSTITVELVTDAGRRVGSAVTDFAGNYAMTSVLPGTYFLRTRNDRGYVDEAYPDTMCASCDARTGTPVVIGVLDVTGIDFTLAAGGVIAGAVTDTTALAVGSVPISLFSPAGTLVGQTIASSSGIFRVTLPAGDYRARADASATHGAEVFSEQPCTSAACTVAAGTAIPVSNGTITPNINFTLASCSAMTLSPATLASAVVGRSYRQVLSVSGGTSPSAFQITDGALPLGVTLSSATGVLSGTPTVSGRHAFTVGALDATSCATARRYTLDVQDCAFILSPTSVTVGQAGAPSVPVTITDSCGPQTVTTQSLWILVASNTPGQVVLNVDANNTSAARIGEVVIGRRVVTVRQAGTSAEAPFGAFDSPLDGAQVSGSLALGGWALDDLEVLRVQIFRDPVAGEAASQIFLGTAVFVTGARPDVQRAYPTLPLNNRAGWGFLVLTNMLPNQGNGIFRIYAYAEDATGARTLLGARTIVANNATATLPFGAIDTPAQGETIAGTGYLNWGWALTPQPKIIPFDGSTIGVYVDGVPLGSVTYNLFRADVAGLFPGLANSGGPVGYRMLDTTALSEGQHTIAWVVTDDQGAASGIGSRYFSVANASDAQPPTQGSASTAPATEAPEASARAVPAVPVAALPGPDSGRRAESLAEAPVTDTHVLARGEGPVRRVRVRDDGSRALVLAALERLELTLAGPDEACSGTWAGYLVEKGTLRDLPVGAAIDPAGTFYWQPGPGFLGAFELLFVRTGCEGEKTRLPVTVTIQGR